LASMLRGRYGIRWMVVAWLALVLCLGAVSYAAFALATWLH